MLSSRQDLGGGSGESVTGSHFVPLGVLNKRSLQ